MCVVYDFEEKCIYIRILNSKHTLDVSSQSNLDLPVCLRRMKCHTLTFVSKWKIFSEPGEVTRAQICGLGGIRIICL
jgi:hypothetical protein